MRIGSLFAGIGGFDLAARWMGWETAWFSEVDPYASAVLAKHWPGVPNHGDITKIDFTTVEPVDMLCGGFPCQDISNAGKRAGITGERSGLWGEYARAVRELRPRYVVVENVAALLGRGFERVLGDLAALGYDAEWEVLSAADVGAPHLRERLWIVAYPDGGQRVVLRPIAQARGTVPPEGPLWIVHRGDGWPAVADTGRAGPPHGSQGDAGSQCGTGWDTACGGGPAGAAVPHPFQSRLEGAIGEVMAGADEGRFDADAPDQIGGQLNPTWVEWLMGYPLGWTALKGLATPSSRNARSSSSRRSKRGSTP